MFALHQDKSFVPAFFKVCVDRLEKEIIVLE